MQWLVHFTFYPAIHFTLYAIIQNLFSLVYIYGVKVKMIYENATWI